MHKKIFIIFLFIVLLCFILGTKTNAENVNYRIVIEDDANLLTASEKAELRKQMVVLTEFGNVMFKTTNSNNGQSGNSALKYIQNYYYSKFNNENGVAFYIDMKERQICACATGNLDEIITSSKCYTITDNVYNYAKKGQYFECAKEAFLQMNSLLNGERIAESMKYICNAIVSIMISLFSSYGLFMLFAGNKKASRHEIIDECEIFLNYTPINVIKVGTHREYSPVSDSSSSGGGSSGGGSGGGGFSGSGGSHSF